MDGRWNLFAPAIPLALYEAVLPIYILHQTVIVTATVFIIKLSLPILPALILVNFCAFAGSIFIYDLIGKRINLHYDQKY